MDCSKKELAPNGGPCRCASSLADRYITTTGTGDGWDNQANEDELLHVLVTRPEIVGKPRDNIVFEGDMDLRTTFETSYEALAKMRLECWKRHQELIGAQTRDCCKAGATICHTKQQTGQRGATKEQSNEESQLLMMDDEVEEEEEDSQQQVVSVADEHEQLVDPKEVVDGGGGLESRSKVEPSSNIMGSAAVRAVCNQLNGKRVDAAVQVDLVQTPSLAASTPQPLMQQHLHKNCYANTQIDPDLTPIIVYDANMNRLERVGLRKRSKYRPSTSLRSGARGLFGDQELERGNGGAANCGSCQAQSINQAQIAGCTQAEVTQKRPQDDHQMMALNDLASEVRYDDLTIRRLEARNLRDSKQNNRLLYSDNNLPIDRKRKLRDNINMIDHVQEQTMSEISRINGIRLVDNSIEQSAKEDNQNQNQNQHQDMMNEEEEMESEMLRFAKKEEEDAIEELRKITDNHVGGDGDSDHNGQTMIQHSDISDRKSRLKRTCQNQHFDIYDNKYQEEVTPLPKSELIERGSRLTPQSKMYINLFRESPDFMQTTGKFLDEEAQEFKRINKIP